MTSKERMLAATRLEVPDYVPVAPDTSNMIPCRLTGKPFWDIYLYQDPPLWKAYTDCCKHFGFDGWLPSAASSALQPPPSFENDRIVQRNDEHIITRSFRSQNGRRVWADRVTVYYHANPPTRGVLASKIGLPDEPAMCEEITGVREWPRGQELFDHMVEYMGDCDLAEVKQTFGSKIALMGNLHTTDVMLRGTPEDVERAAKWCIDVAAEGGGYVLSTGDQCGRDTPDENIRVLIDVARSYGKY